MELADGGVAGRPHLAVDVRRSRSARLGRLPPAASSSIVSRQAQKSPPAARPRSARWNAWQCAFTKPGSVERLGHAATLSFSAWPPAPYPAPLAQLPNALTICRLALIPVFVVADASAPDDGPSWAAASSSASPA